ncbi:hypothetical protein ALC57_12817 [Trachymyrmex cornetzi]|uniref:Uncharacterized protein n=1 Tax=Trachymyrmex cornetzi TaxID=471704 RepID=A0A151J0M4_9HYME|nr:hypothetical protein ALC57_12817 [Trachymyrmex cornetzi]
MVPETCRNNLSERTAGLASPACWPRRAVGAPYLEQLSHAALLRFRGSLFISATISAQLSPMMKHSAYSTPAGVGFELIAGADGTVVIDGCGFGKVPLPRFNFFFFYNLSR